MQNLQNNIFKKLITIFIISFLLFPYSISFAVFNKQINYQGKLTNSSNVAVPNGTYNMEFKLYTVDVGGVAIWTETRTGVNKVQVTSGLFSVLLGEVTTLTGIDFNQTLYLGVNIGGTGTPGWDGEMSPRKKLGAVPAAVEAENSANSTIADDTTTNGLMYPAWVTGTTGNLPIKVSSTKLTFNPSTGILTTYGLTSGAATTLNITSGTTGALNLDSGTTGTINIGTGTAGKTINIGTNNTTADTILIGSALDTIKLSKFATNGFLKTSAGDGTLSVDTTTYLSAEADTLATVTGRGATTATASSFTGGATIRGLTVDTATATDDQLVALVTPGGVARFTGTMTLADITGSNKTYTFPDANITVNAAGDLSGTTLAANVVTSSLTTVGALASGSIASGFGTIASGAITVTSSSSNALVVGANGATNPAFNVDASTASSVTGIQVKSGILGGGVALTTLSTGAAEALTISAKGSGTLTLAGVSTGDIQFFSASNKITSTGALTVAGAISAPTATNTINGLIINAGALSGITTLSASGQITSTVATGAAPFVVASTTPVANLSIGGNAATATTATNATNTTNVGITDDTITNATMYPTWVTANTGNLPIKVSSTKLSFNPSTGVLTSTGFAGPLTGNVTGNVSGSAATVTAASQPAITTLANLVTTGALTSGSIASGFGTIATSNTITGTTLNGTTGINTGAVTGTQRIDSSGNLVNIGNLTSTGALSITSGSGNITLQPSGTGTTGRVIIGAANGGAGSLTPDLFVVDKASSTLPTGVEGSIILDSTGKFNIYESGAWKILCNTTDAACGAGSGTALSAISAAISGNTINSGDNAQVWNWSLTTAAKNAFTFTENTASINGAGSQYILNVATIAASTAAPLQVVARGNKIIDTTSLGGVTIGNATAGQTITVGASSGTDLVLQDANWGVTGAGVGSFTGLTLSGAITSASGNLTLQPAGTGTTANVVIGAANGGAGSATPDLLVLDKTSTTLPTGVEGAIVLTSTGKFNIYESGAWKELCNKTDAACGAGSGTALSSVTAATTSNSINSGDNAQAWNWSLTTPSKNAFSFTENIASTLGAGSQYILNVATIASSTAAPLQVVARGNKIIDTTSTGGLVLGNSAVSQALTLTGSANSVWSTSAGTLTIQSGDGTASALAINTAGKTGANTGAIALTTGTATTTGNSGAINIDTGAAAGGTTGVITIGTTNSSGVTIGKTGAVTNVNGVNINNSAVSNVTTLALSGAITGATTGTINGININSGALSGITTIASGAHTITSASANALVAGLNGATNPAFNVDASTALSATGLQIKSAAAGGGLAVTTLSSGLNENLTISAKGTGTLTLASSSTGDIQFFGSSYKITSAGVLTVASCVGCSSGVTLDTAYTNGNTITTDSGNNVIITLQDVVTPTSFVIENQDTVGVNAQRIFNSIATGTLTNGLLIEQAAGGAMTNAIQVTGNSGTITNGLLIADGAGAITNGIQLTGTFTTALLDTPSLDISGTGAVSGATGISSSGTINFSGLTASKGVFTDGSKNLTSTGTLGADQGGTGVANNIASTITISGAFGTTFTVSGATAVTLPTSGTLYGTATGSITSAQLSNSLTDEQGSGSAVFATSPTLTTPILGVATATSINKITITQPPTGGTLTIGDGTTLSTSGADVAFSTNAIQFGGGTIASTFPSGTSTLYGTGTGSITSLQLATSLSDETGTGLAVFNNNPTFVGMTLSGFTQGSVLFAGASGAVTQDNANYFWDNTNKRLGLGTNAPVSNFQVSQSTAGVGTVSTTATLTTVTGVGTQFLNTFKVGDTITVNAETRTISAIASNTSLTTDAWTGTNSGLAYTLVGGTRLSVLGNGNVGIGTTAPSALLHLYGADKELRIESSAGTPQFSMYSGTGNAGFRNWALKGNNAAAGNLDLYRSTTAGGVATTHVMSWDTNGNVGIGTTSPEGKLTIEGHSFIRSGGYQFFRPADNSYDFEIASSGSGGAAILKFGSNSFANTAMAIKTDGNVGIGTTGPATALHVRTGGNTYVRADADTGGYAGYQLTTAGTVNWGIYRAPSRTDLSFFNSNPIEVVTIQQSGNVGIGTTGPGTQLEIYKSLASATTLQSLLTLNSDYGSAAGTGFGSAIVFRGRTAGNLMQDNAKIAGYNPDANDNGYSLGFFTAPSVGVMTERVTITRGGNVGIGTITPGAKLDIDSTTSDLPLLVRSNNAPFIQLKTAATSESIYLQKAVASGGGLDVLNNAQGSIVKILNSGNVGIGNTSPGTLLHVGATTLAKTTIGQSLVTLGSRIMVGDVQELGMGRDPGATLPMSAIGNIITAGDAFAKGAIYFATRDVTTDTAPTERMRITTTGNVGIGTNTPGSKLEINDQSVAPILTINGANASVFRGIAFQAAGSTQAYDRYNSATGEFRRESGQAVGFGGFQSFYTDSTEKMRITSAGNVGIGTNAPTSNFQVAQATAGVGTVSNLAGGTTVTGVGTQFTNTFKVGDTITIPATTGQTVAISAIASDTSMTTAAITLANSGVAYSLVGGDRFVVKGNGNVGIGLVNPSTFKLEVAGSVGPEADNTRDLGSGARRWANIYGTNITGAITPTGFTQGSVVFAGASGLLSQDNANFFWDNTNKRLGIGLVNPSYKLEVRAPVSDTSALATHIQRNYPTISVSGTNYYKVVEINGRDADIDLGVTESGYRIGLDVEHYFDTANFQGTLAQQYGIWTRVGANGASPTGTITNSYGIYIDNLTAAGVTQTNMYGVYQSSTGAKNYFGGNVGIGTSSPTVNLDIYNSAGWGTLDLDGTSGGEIHLQQAGTTYGQIYANAPTSSGMVINAAGAGNDMYFQSASSTKITLLDTGFFGIGTTNPIYGKLSVQYDGTGAVTNALNLHNGGATANGTGSKIRFTALRALGDTQDFSYIDSVVTDNTTSAEDARLTIGTMVNGTLTNTLTATSGNVGIGITNPGAPLDIRAATGWQNIQSTTTTNYAYTQYSNGGGVTLAGMERSIAGGLIPGSTAYAGIFGTTGANPVQFATNNAIAMTILSGGNVGIGTTAPASTLSVAPAAQSGTPALTGSATSILTNTFTDNATAISGTATNFVSNSIAAPTLAATNTSVTTTNAYTNYITGAPIKGTNNTATNAIALGIGAGAVGAQINSYGLYVNTQTGATNNYAATFMGGNVGIGTASPQAPLEVLGTTGNRALFRSSTNTSYTGFRLYNDQNNSTRALEIDYSGSAFATALLSGGPTGESASIATTGAYPLVFGTDNTARMTITPGGGNVGIGTTTPQTKLYVRGTPSTTIGASPQIQVNNQTGVGYLAEIGFGFREAGYTYSSSTIGEVATSFAGYTKGDIYFATRDVVTDTAPSERMRITSGGNVGIQTSSPVSNFQVAQGTTGVGTVSNLAGGTTVTGVGTQFTNTFKVGDTITIPATTGQTVTISAIASDTSMTTAAITAANTGVAYSLVGGDRFVVKGNGNVGIGLVNPSTFKLEVAGNVGPEADNTRDLGSGARRWANIYGTNITGAITPTGFTQGSVVFAGASGLLSQDNANFFWDNTNKRLGIGLVNPSYKLEVRAPVSDTSALSTHIQRNYPTISVSGTNYYKVVEINGRDADIDLGVTESGYRIGLDVEHYFDTANFQGTLAQQYGIWTRVGANGASPTGTITNSYGIYIDNLTAAGVTQTNMYGVYQSSTGAKNYFGGNVGIGTTNPEQKFHVSGTSVGSDGSQTNISAFVNNGIRITGSLDSASQDAITYRSGSGGGAALAFGRNAGYGTYTAFYTNNTAAVGAISERMRIDAVGNVGIGTTNPTGMLQLGGSGTLSPTNASYKEMHAGGFGILFRDAYDSYITSNTQYTATGWLNKYGGFKPAVIDLVDGSINFETGTGTTAGGASGLSSKMIILNSGNVGIGTTAPGAKLAIQGTGTYNSTNWGTASDMAIRSSEMSDNAYHSILQLVAIRESLTVGQNSQGYLGFSTIDDSNAQGMKDAGRIAIVNESGGSRNSATALSFWTNPGGADDTVAATEKMRIDSTGNVGIGTTTPGEKLEVKDGKIYLSDADITQPLTAQLPANTYGALRPTSGTEGGLDIIGVTDVVGSTYPMNLRAYFGTTDPTDSVPAMMFQAGKQNTTDYTALADAETAFQWYNGVNARMTMLGSGNLGIGITNPSYPLDVNGIVQGRSYAAFGSASANAYFTLYASRSFTAPGAANPSVGIRTDGTITGFATAAHNMYGMQVENSFAEGATSGTHALVAQLFVGGNAITTTGAASTTDAATLYLSGPMSGATNNYALYSTSGTNYFGGNVGIGTTNPISKVHVQGTGSEILSLTSMGGIHMANGYNDGSWGVRLAGIDNGVNGHNLQIQTRNTNNGSFVNSMTVTSSGNVGIGTVTPTLAKLQVAGTIGILEGGATPTKYTILQGGDQTIDLTYTLPTGYPAVSGYVLSATDAGVMSWVAAGGGGDMVLASIQTVTGAKTFNSGKLILAGATSGTTILNATAVAGAGTVTLPTSGTLYGTETGSITSAQLLNSLSDETGTGLAVFSVSPSFTTPSLGVATATTINKVAITTPATGSTLTIADGKTLSTNETVAFSTNAIQFAGGTIQATYPTGTYTLYGTLANSITSADLASSLTNETGTAGSVVFSASPTLTGSLTLSDTYYNFNYSAGQTISVALGTETWIKLATFPNRTYAKIRVGVGSSNSEEESEIEIVTTYTTSSALINVTRQTYNNHLREVRVTGTDGGAKSVYIRIRTDSFAPTVNWRVVDSKGITSIDNVEASPTGGAALVVNGNLTQSTNGGVNIGGNVGIGTTNPGQKLEVVGNATVSSGQKFMARYDTSDNYHGSLNWYGLQLGNNGNNYIVGGRTNVGGNLTFVVNNTSDFPTVNGTTALTLASTGAATFGSTVTGGTYNGQTISSAANFTGTMTVASNVTMSNSAYTTYGPNTSWSSYLRVGGNGYTAGNATNYASVVTTNGNLHLDSGGDKSMYLNYYSGTGGIYFGNGATGSNANVSAAGVFTGTNFSGPGTGLTGTAASLTAGLASNLTGSPNITVGTITSGLINGQTISSTANFTGTLAVGTNLTVTGETYLNGTEIQGDSKTMLRYSDGYLRINEDNEFANGIWMGPSHLLGSTGYLAVGSNGGTTTSSTYLVGAYTGTNLIKIDSSSSSATSYFNAGNVGIGTTAPLDKFQVAASNSIIALGESGGSNLIFNGGGEDAASGWTSRDFGVDASAGTGSSSSAAALSGTLSFSATNDGGLNQAVEVIPSGIYTISLRMRVNVQGVGDASQGRIVVGTTTTARDIVDQACNPNTYDVNPNTNKWVHCSATFTAPAATDLKTSTVYVGFRAEGSTHTVLVDNVMLSRGGIPQSYNSLATFVGSNGATALTGNVGIGTTSPGAKLESYGGANVDLVRVNYVGNTGGLGIDSAATYWGTSIFQAGTKRFTVESNNGILVGGSYQGNDAPADGAIIQGNVGIGTTSPDAPIHAKGGTAMTAGWNRTGTLEATFPTLVFNSNSTRWAGIAYDYSSNLNIRVGSTSNDIFASGMNALSFNATSGAAAFGSTVTGGTYNGQTITSAASFTGTVAVTTDVTAPYYKVNAAVGYGLCFWTDCTNYKISMGNSAEYQYGPVSDYSIKNTMSNTAGRGFTWGIPGGTPIAALGVQNGNFQIAGTLTVSGASGTINGSTIYTAANDPLDTIAEWQTLCTNCADIVNDTTGTLTVGRGGTGATSLTGLLIGNGASAFTATTVSSGISGQLSDETGTGVAVFGTSPTFTTSALFTGGGATDKIANVNTSGWGVDALNNSTWDLLVYDGAHLYSGDMYFGYNGTAAIRTYDTNEDLAILPNGTGNVGVGTSTPLKKLDVAGSARVTGTASSTISGTGATNGTTTLTGTNTLFTTELVVGDRVTVNAETRVVSAIASNTSLTVTVAFSGTVSGVSITRLPALLLVRDSSNVVQMRVADDGGWWVGVNGTGKIDADVWDPPYTIGGTQYATYGVSMVGVKEEVTGIVNISEKVDNVGYRHVIDFKNLPEASDLWLFSKVAHISKHIDRMTVLLSPEGNTRTWYDVDPDNFTLTIYSSKETKVSYRLSAPKFNSDKWTNLNPNGSPGTLISGEADFPEIIPPTDPAPLPTLADSFDFDLDLLMEAIVGKFESTYDVVFTKGLFKVAEIVTDKLTAKQLCLEGVCIDKTQLEAIIANNPVTTTTTTTSGGSTTITTTQVSLDSNPPTISLNGDSIVSVNVGDTYVEQGALAVDDVDGTTAVVISGDVDTSIPGVYTITYLATDLAGNQAMTVTRTVNVASITTTTDTTTTTTTGITTPAL